LNFEDELDGLADGRLNLRRRTVRQGTLTVLGQVCQAVLMLASTAILARLLQPRDFGLVAMVSVVTAFVSVIQDIGLTQAVVQRDRIDGRQLTALFWVNLAATVLLALAVIAAAPVVAWFYGEASLVGLTAVFGSFVVLGGLGSLHHALLVRRMQFGKLVAIELASLLAGIVIAVLLAMVGAGYWALVALAGVRAGLQLILLWLTSPWQPGPPRRIGDASGMLRFGANVTGFNLANFLSRQADNLLIGWRWGPGQLGLYSRAYGVLLLPLRQLNAPLARVAVPVLARLVSRPDRYRHAYVRVLRVTAAVGCMGLAFVAVTADWVIAVVLGPGWEGAGPILTWLAIGGALQPISNTTGWLFITQDRTGDYLRWGLVSSLLTVGAFVVGLPFGAVGVAAAYGLSGLTLRAPLLFWYVGRTGPVSTADIVKATAFPLGVASLVGTSLVALRVTTDLRPGPGLAASVMVALVVAGSSLLVPSGGRLLSDLRQMVADLRPSTGTPAHE
jgi:O-antigen/teichoic acid export membrane protein